MAGGLNSVRGDIALTLTAAGAGTVTSGSFGNAGEAAVVMAGLHLTTLTGTTPTAVLTLEQSANGSTGWTAIPGAAATQLTGAGSATVTAVATANYVRASVAIGGTTPAATGAVAVVIFAD